ncbi:MAG TPA: NAD(P)-dependent oxidoreductase [Candidatus Saccharimonadales bacterium]|jgi:dTDP-4-dehydrorhamnose 3,5-epimerase|nr:NAD(P)-dependent oxidoreductase [Candidatus Saccharimonadales bacterium]
MDESRFLIVGAYGQLGKALQAKYPKATAVDRDTFDMTDWDMISKYDWSKFDVILNAAAYTNVDGAETEEGRPVAWKINATGPGYLSKVATEHGLTLVHVSTDYVFDGSRSPHTEDEDVAPLGVYAQAKAAGDIATSITPQYYILRTHALIGDGPNFVRTMLGLAEKNISPTVVADQITRLTFTPTLVGAIDHLLATKAEYGIYNASNDGEPASWADITRAIFKEIGRDDLTVTDTTTDEYFKSKSHVAPRPLKSFFDLSKIKAAGFVIPDWRSELHAYIQAEQAKPKE